MCSPWNGRNMVTTMKHETQGELSWKLELECHYVDLFHDGE
jgi:hypothetical protein